MFKGTLKNSQYWSPEAERRNIYIRVLLRAFFGSGYPSHSQFSSIFRLYAYKHPYKKDTFGYISLDFHGSATWPRDMPERKFGTPTQPLPVLLVYKLIAKRSTQLKAGKRGFKGESSTVFN